MMQSHSLKLSPGGDDDDDKVKFDNEGVEKEVFVLTERNEELEQYMRLNNVLIDGIQKLEKENVTDKVLKIGEKKENQEREVERLEHKEQKKQEERAMQIQLLREGKRPQFPKPVEKRLLELVDQYKELKKNGKLKKHIEKHRKKVMLKDKKKMREHNQIVLGEG
uniref:rRNA biogenesis protein RRP36 n=1 Tax=Timema cristinae TaxID=61476 RepID=A0A7R9GZV6_TIMCR|nr:unnamed protein product [Timema cristinae]